MLTTGERPLPGSIALPAFTPARWPRWRAWLAAMMRWLAVWVLALAVTLVAVTLTLHPPFGHLLSIVQYLLIGGAASVGIGAAALWVTDVGRIGGMRLKFAVPPLLTALIISFNVMLVAHEMFLSAADSTLVLDILVFSVLLAIALSSSIAGTIAGAIRRVEAGARRIAAGEYSARLPETELGGATELTHLGRWFNQMAASVEDAFASRQRAEHERRQIVAAVSHDLRTPLASVRAMIEAITDGVVTDPVVVSRYQQTIRAEVRRLSHLIDDLFELSRLEAGLLTHGGTQGEVVALEDLISDALEAMGGQAAQRGVRLGGWVEEALPPVVVDAGRIHRVLINLVQNALRHTAPGGRVAIHARVQAPATPAAPACVLVRVVDSGEGIAAADLPHIFEPTYRGESSRRWNAARQGERGESGRADHTAPTTSGAGLGLTIARGLVEAHGGAMWAESPLSREAAALLAGDAAAPETARHPDAASRLDHSAPPQGTLGHAGVPPSAEGPGTCIAFTIPVDVASAPRGRAAQ